MLIARLAGNAKRIAVPAVENSALVDEDVVPRCDGLLLGLLHGPAGSGAQRFAVVQRNHLEHDAGRIGSVNLSKSLRATSAGCALDPDDRIQVALACSDDGLLKSLSNAGSGGFTQADHDRERATQFHEATTRNSARFEHALKLWDSGLVVHTYTSYRCFPKYRRVALS